MSEFSDCFLLVFGQLAVGGIAALAVPPFQVLERGFYKSSAGVFVGAAALFVAGKVALALRTGILGEGGAIELGLWALFKYGPDASVLIRLVLALIITVLGIFLGAMLDARSGESSEHARYA